MDLPALTSDLRPRLSFRLKLTLWMTVIFLAVQLLLVLVLQLYQHRSINQFFDERILARQTTVADDLGPQVPGLTREALVPYAELHRTMMGQTLFRVTFYHENGDVLVSSDELAKPLDPAARIRLTQEKRPIIVQAGAIPVLAQSSTGERSAAGWTTGKDGRPYIVEVAWSDMFASRMLKIVSGMLFFTIPIGVVAVMVSAYAISGVAVQPIRAMREMAKGLQPEFLGRSVPFSMSGSEVADLRRDLEATRQKLETAFGAQERMMSNVSHELKTPISVIMTEAQTLKLDQASKEVKAFVGSALEELDKLGRMVDSFLLLSRVRHGKASVPNREICLARDVMMQSYEGCIAMAAQYGVRVIITLPENEESEISVRGNCDLLRTVLDNLLRNAIRFSPKGEPVSLSARSDGDRLLFVVSDRGVGIPSELLPRLFDRFAQSTEEQKRGRGHGLGLEIAMGITELHGGTIAVRNLEERGCEFTVSLPLSRDMANRLVVDVHRN